MGRIMAVDQARPSAEAISAAGRALASGGVVVLPTDSVYGISCAATAGNPGHGRIFDIKRRDRAQTLPWLVSDEGDLSRYGTDVPEWGRRLARALWPGALTLVVRASDAVPAEYRRADGTIALRVPDSELVRSLVRAVGAPLATTSANTHGAPSPVAGTDLEAAIVAGADLALDGGVTPAGAASTIVGCTGDSPAILREGAIPSGRIRAIAGGGQGGDL